ncbi:MAG: NERD domain-containing protein, partial [Bacillus sp. (in: firmicutes)]
TWICPTCQTSSKDAILKALSDYYYLYKPTITNQELRDFLHLPNTDITQKVLHRLKLPTTGKTKDRLYYLQPKEVTTCVS